MMGTPGVPGMGSEVEIKKLRGKLNNGYHAHSITIRSMDTGEVLFESTSFFRSFVKSRTTLDDFRCDVEKKLVLPKRTVSSRAILCSLTFSSEESIQNFNCSTDVYLAGTFLEHWDTSFGFVIPGSTNTWETCIVRSDTEFVEPYISSGNVIIDSVLRDGELPLRQFKIRLFFK